ncbi:MAG: PEGA domain-containing protein [Bacteroidales bacterium]|nr:PEGA domain-containing protein [Bacteroidales bacterium]
MRRFLIVLQALLIPMLMSAQINMSVSGRAELDSQDNDARSYYSLKDANDMDCAIIKVSLNNPVTGTLVLQTKGGAATVKSEKRPDGEWWFWVSPVVTNIMFSCEGYTPTKYLGVNLRGKNVYRLKLTVDAAIATVTTFTLGQSVMKLNVFPPEATVLYGRTPDCDMGSRVLSDGLFEAFLDKGTYYYRIESRFYEPATGKYEVTGDSPEVSVSLKPAFNYLCLDSEPSGAEVYVNGRLIGTTPIAKSDKIRRGQGIRLEFRKEDYYIQPVTIDIPGDGSVQEVPTVELRPQFGWVTCVCDDPDATLTVSDASKIIATGKSGLRVKLNSGGTTYKLESSRPSHHSQAQGIKGSTIEGKEVEIKVDAPVGIYGGLQISSSPSRARVFIDGVDTKKTTAFSREMLIGRHTVELKLDGYHLDPFTVEIEEGQVVSIAKAMIKGPGDGFLSVSTGNVSGATVNITGGKAAITKFSPFTTSLPEGKYTVTATHSGYKKASSEVFIHEAKTTSLNLTMRKDVHLFNWKWGWEEDKFAKYFLDYEMGFVPDDFAIGLQYAQCGKHLGYYLRFMSAIGYEETSFSAGPVVRLTWDYRKVDWQLYAGTGFMYEGMGVEAGTRLGWHSDKFSWFDIGAGIQVTPVGVVPTVSLGLGICLFPYALLYSLF